jgi:hypothetical protein
MTSIYTNNVEFFNLIDLSTQVRGGEQEDASVCASCHVQTRWRFLDLGREGLPSSLDKCAPVSMMIFNYDFLFKSCARQLTIQFSEVNASSVYWSGKLTTTRPGKIILT